MSFEFHLKTISDHLFLLDHYKGFVALKTWKVPCAYYTNSRLYAVTRRALNTFNPPSNRFLCVLAGACV